MEKELLTQVKKKKPQHEIQNMQPNMESEVIATLGIRIVLFKYFLR